MEGLEKNIKNLTSILNGLDRMLKHLEYARKNTQKYGEIDIEGFQDSSIKKFELSFGLFWHMLKEYLEEHHAISIASPKKAIHLSFVEAGLLDAKESELLLEMVDNRNASTHDYDYDSAAEFCKRIPFYHQLMSDVLLKLKNELE